MWAIAFGTPEAIIFRGTHLAFALTLTFLVTRRSEARKDEPPSLLDYALLVLAVAPVVYLFVNYDYVVNRIYYIDDLTWSDMALGTILVVMVLVLIMLERKVFEIWLKQSPNRRLTYRLDDDAIVVETESGNARYEWKGLRRLWRYGDVWLIEIVRNMSVFFPTSAPEAVREFVVSRCREAGIKT